MKAAIYVRVSTEEQAETGHGLESQLAACRDFIEARGWEEVKAYEDVVTGRRVLRPGLDRMLRDAALHRFNAVVAFRLDRLTRGGIREAFRVLETLQGRGVRVYSVADGWWHPDDPTSEVVLAVLAWAAQMESEASSRRIKAGVKRRRDKAEKDREPFLWGKGFQAYATRDPTLPEKVKAARAAGQSWRAIVKAFGLKSTATAWRLAKKAQAAHGAHKGVAAEPAAGPLAEEAGEAPEGPAGAAFPKPQDERPQEKGS